MELPLPELWRLRSPERLLRGVAQLRPCAQGVEVISELLAPRAQRVEGLAQILFPCGLPCRALSFSTVLTDSFTHRTYLAVTAEASGATCAWSPLAEVAAPSFLRLMEAIEKDERRLAIWRWLLSAPAPPPGTALILHGVHREALLAASRPPPAGLPAVHVPLQLLTRLSVSVVLLLTKLVLLEQKILFVSSSVAQLTAACEAFSSILLFPLAWVHCYNPLLPSTDYLATPPPFLFGCLREIILKETFADSNDLTSSELFKDLKRDFTIIDLDTGDIYAHQEELPDLPDAAQSRLRYSFTELRSQLEAKHDQWPRPREGHVDFQDAVQRMFLTFMADLLGDVAGSLGPQCETATAASVLSSFQEAHFLSMVSAKDRPFFEPFVQSNAFLAYLQTLHLFGTSDSPFAEALRSLGHQRREAGHRELPAPPLAPLVARQAAAVRLGTDTVLELHLAFQTELEVDGLAKVEAEEWSEDPDGCWGQLAHELYGAELKGLKLESPESRWSFLLLYALLCRRMGASPEFQLRLHLALERPAALPTHRILALMNEMEPHHLCALLAEGVAESFCRRLLAVVNPTKLAVAEAALDPLQALGFVVPEEAMALETVEVPRVELLPFKGPKETCVLNHRRFCNWTDRSPEVLSAQLVRDVYSACLAVEKGSSKAYKLLERLSEPLAELQCCSLQGKNHEVRLSFWLNCLNASTLLAALAPSRIGIPERPGDLASWVQLIQTAQLEVQGDLVSLADMEQAWASKKEFNKV